MKDKLQLLTWVLMVSICLYGLIIAIPNAMVGLRLAERECAHARVEIKDIQAELKSLQAAYDNK